MVPNDKEWFKVADTRNELMWQENKLLVTEAAGKKITLALINDTIHACAFKCPHAGGILADGFLDAVGNLVCPLHRYKFNLKTGRNVSGEGYYLKVYAVEEREEGIFVRFEKSSWKDLFK